MNRVTKRPAETMGLAGALALLVSRLAGVSDPDVIVALGIVFASLPAVTTWIVLTVRGRSASGGGE